MDKKKHEILKQQFTKDWNTFPFSDNFGKKHVEKQSKNFRNVLISYLQIHNHFVRLLFRIFNAFILYFKQFSAIFVAFVNAGD